MSEHALPVLFICQNSPSHCNSQVVLGSLPLPRQVNGTPLPLSPTLWSHYWPSRLLISLSQKALAHTSIFSSRLCGIQGQGQSIRMKPSAWPIAGARWGLDQLSLSHYFPTLLHPQQKQLPLCWGWDKNGSVDRCGRRKLGYRVWESYEISSVYVNRYVGVVIFLPEWLTDKKIANCKDVRFLGSVRGLSFIKREEDFRGGVTRESLHRYSFWVFMLDEGSGSEINHNEGGELVSGLRDPLEETVSPDRSWGHWSDRREMTASRDRDGRVGTTEGSQSIVITHDNQCCCLAGWPGPPGDGRPSSSSSHWPPA